MTYHRSNRAPQDVAQLCRLHKTDDCKSNTELHEERFEQAPWECYTLSSDNGSPPYCQEKKHYETTAQTKLLNNNIMQINLYGFTTAD